MTSGSKKPGSDDPKGEVNEPNSPAIGFRASAACAEVSMLVNTLGMQGCRRRDHDRHCDDIRVHAARVSARIHANAAAGFTLTSSASSEACQKKRYG